MSRLTFVPFSFGRGSGAPRWRVRGEVSSRPYRRAAGLLALGVLAAASSSGCRTNACKTSPLDDGEVCLEGGAFEMGHDKLPRPGGAFPGIQLPTNDWYPQHAVTLPAFYVDRFEVTWGQYRACVEAGICTSRLVRSISATSAAWDDPAQSSRPAFYVSWDEASTYCLWKGKRLPTEAEFERAARGPSGFDYPWGNAPPSTALLNAVVDYAGNQPVAPVGSQPQDVTPEGIHDLFGSVSEWTADWYDPDYYFSSPARSPPGPSAPSSGSRAHEYGLGGRIVVNGERAVRGPVSFMRGGADWDFHGRGWPAWFRGQVQPGRGIGFRCAHDDGTQPAAAFPVYQRMSWHTPRRLP